MRKPGIYCFSDTYQNIQYTTWQRGHFNQSCMVAEKFPSASGRWNAKSSRAR
jgi:hypothetical protein